MMSIFNLTNLTNLTNLIHTIKHDECFQPIYRHNPIHPILTTRCCKELAFSDMKVDT